MPGAARHDPTSRQMQTLFRSAEMLLCPMISASVGPWATSASDRHAHVTVDRSFDTHLPRAGHDMGRWHSEATNKDVDHCYAERDNDRRQLIDGADVNSPDAV